MHYQLFKAFIDAISSLTLQQTNILNDALVSVVNPPKPILEAKIESKFSQHPTCAYCHGQQLKRWGQSEGRQRYRCTPCAKTFNAFTGTPLARLRQPEKWQDYLDGMADSATLRIAARDYDVTLHTSFRWRHRFLQVLENDQAGELSGIVELDETFFRESFKGQKSNLPRPARHRGSDSKKACRKVPVLVARDRSAHTVDGLLDNETATEMKKHLQGHVSASAILCADASLAHEKLARDMGLPLKELVTSAGQHVVEEVFHIQHVNAYHSHLKRWIDGVFYGVATKYLKHYLGWRRILTESVKLTGGRLLDKIAAHWFKQQSTAT